MSSAARYLRQLAARFIEYPDADSFTDKCIAMARLIESGGHVEASEIENLARDTGIERTTCAMWMKTINQRLALIRDSARGDDHASDT